MKHLAALLVATLALALAFLLGAATANHGRCVSAPVNGGDRHVVRGHTGGGELLMLAALTGQSPKGLPTLTNGESSFAP